MAKKPKDGSVLKSDVLWIIQDYIRGIQMNDYGSDSGIPQLYAVMAQIEEMEVQEANWLQDNGALVCSHCGYRFYNGMGSWVDHCAQCGYKMV